MPRYSTRTITITVTVIIGLIHRFTENIALESMSHRYIFTNECIDFKIPILINVQARPGI